MGVASQHTLYLHAVHWVATLGARVPPSLHYDQAAQAL